MEEFKKKINLYSKGLFKEVYLRLSFCLKPASHISLLCEEFLGKYLALCSNFSLPSPNTELRVCRSVFSSVLGMSAFSFSWHEGLHLPTSLSVVRKKRDLKLCWTKICWNIDFFEWKVLFSSACNFCSSNKIATYAQFVAVWFVAEWKRVHFPLYELIKTQLQWLFSCIFRARFSFVT